MKITKKELSILIESYLKAELINERLQVIDDTGYEVPKCDFKFDPEFLEMIEFIKLGGKRPSGRKDYNENKPDMFNPLFTDALTSQLLPFMNLMVAPMFGIKAKCDTMRKMQNLFNSMYRDFSSGFEVSTATKLDPINKSANITSTAKALKEKYYAFFPGAFNEVVRRNRLALTDSRYSREYIDTTTPVAGFHKSELEFASYILGDLSKARNENSRAVNRIIRSFRSARKVDNAASLIDMTKSSSVIPGYDAAAISSLINGAVGEFTDAAQGSAYMHDIILRLFEKLEASGIIRP